MADDIRAVRIEFSPIHPIYLRVTLNEDNTNEISPQRPRLTICGVQFGDSAPFRKQPLSNHACESYECGLERLRLRLGRILSGGTTFELSRTNKITGLVESRSGKCRTGTKSIFGPLTEGIRPFSTSKSGFLTRRPRWNARKKLLYSDNRRYKPVFTVRDSEVKLKLVKIARLFQFLDRGFAEYFQVVLPSFGKEHIQSLLDECRMTLSKIQNQNHNSTVLDLGDLGNFCEKSIQTWNRPSMRGPEFCVTYQRVEEIMHYLRDALEIPYWDFMIDLFLDWRSWRSNVESLSGDAVLCILHGVRQNLIDERRRLDVLITCSGLDQKDTALILEGIDDRMRVLHSLWCSTVSKPSLDRKFDPHSEESRQSSAATIEWPPFDIQPQSKGHQTENVALISSVLIFLIAAIVPGYKAFALSMQDGTTGSINDADFWYLVQSSIMAVLGNIIMVVPLLRKSWFSPAYSLMWVFFALGLTFACIAVAIYPLLNTGWSSMVSFFGSISSVASVLVMTQAVAKESRHEKIKAD